MGSHFSTRESLACVARTLCCPCTLSVLIPSLALWSHGVRRQAALSHAATTPESLLGTQLKNTVDSV